MQGYESTRAQGKKAAARLASEARAEVSGHVAQEGDVSSLSQPELDAKVATFIRHQQQLVTQLSTTIETGSATPQLQQRRARSGRRRGGEAGREGEHGAKHFVGARSA